MQVARHEAVVCVTTLHFNNLHSAQEIRIIARKKQVEGRKISCRDSMDVYAEEDLVTGWWSIDQMRTSAQI